MHLKQYVAVAAAAALWVAVAVFITPDPVVANPTLGPSMAIENIAPGQSGKAGAISLDADTNADFLEWEGDGDGATGDPDIWPIAHGSRVTFLLQDAAECSCCVLADVNEATTTAVGAQSGNTTRFVVEGGDEGSCFALDGEGAIWTEVVNYNALSRQGHMPAGVCATETANNDDSGYNVFGICAADADCDSDGGHPASTTCDLTPSDRLDYRSNLPGVYYACRCSAAADIAYWVTR